MLRNALAVLLGFLLAKTLSAIVEISILAYHFGLNRINLFNKVLVKNLISQASFSVLMLTVISYSIGGLLGGFLTAFIVKRAKMGYALLIGLMLTLAIVLRLWMYPYHPFWFNVSTVLVFLPSSWIGGWFALQLYYLKKKNKPKSS